MYPSPRYLHAPLDGATTASPKKKPRPNVLRQLYALPAIHQFEPVLAAPAASPSPRSAPQPLARDESPPLAEVSPARPLRLNGSSTSVLSPRSDVKVSPRLRPQPPPQVAMPAAAVASRTDQDLFRYSQGVKQRMAIRPIFEQRREEEADVARSILVSRETETPGNHQGRAAAEENEFAVRYGEGTESPEALQRVATYSASRRSTTPVTATEIAGLRSSNGRSSGTPRSKRGRMRLLKGRGESESTGSGCTTELDGGMRENDDIQLVDVRFRTPTPSSSAGPSKNHIAATTPGEQVLTRSLSERTDTTDTVEETTASTSTTTESAARRESFDTKLTDGGSLVTPIDSTTAHVAFLERRASKMSWLARTPSISQAPPLWNHDKVVPTAASAASVCFKLLWKDTKSLLRKGDDEAVREVFEMRVLLGSHGKAHIAIQRKCVDEAGDGDHQVLISDSDLVASTRTRPDLPVMTPKWAKWILSRLERDARNAWFLRIEDIFSMGEACVFSEDVLLASSDNTSGSQDQQQPDQAMGVTIYRLGGDETEALLVHARDRSSALQPLTEILLKRHELETLAQSLARSVKSPDPAHEVAPTPSAEELELLVRDKMFLRRAIAESKTLRLILRSGLHIAESANSAADLPVRTASRAATSTWASFDPDNRDPEMQTESQGPSRTIAEYEAQGLTYATLEIRDAVRSNGQLAEIAFVAQAYCEDASMAALWWMQRTRAVEIYVASYVQGDASTNNFALSEGVRRRIDAAKQAKLEDIAARAIVEDMLHDFIAVECRLELHHAKFSGGFDDYYASKLQSTYRMSYQRRDYVTKRHVRQRAVCLIQALQRGITARRRYCEMRVEREKYMFYGFRSSLHDATASIEDPRQRAMDISRELERRRQTFLMQVLHGYVAEHGLPLPFRISPELVQRIFNEFSVIVGCNVTLGDTVAAILVSSRHPEPLPKKADAKAPPPRLFGSGEIHAALVTALRMEYDDTFGLSTGIRRLVATEKSPTKAQLLVTKRQCVVGAKPSDENTLPRWLLKVSPPFQRANRNRLASLRLTRKAAGQRAAHLVALDYRNLLRDGFVDFDKCRAIWEDSIRARKQQTLQFDAFTVDELVQYALDRLTLAVKDRGLDPEPLFEALNLCLLHRIGKQAIVLTEEAFNKFARGMNDIHCKRNIYPLRDEISQELEEFESLLALRCLNIANDNVVTVPPSEILHVLLTGKVDDEYLRHALPSVLPIASIGEKVQLAYKMMRGYANASYGEAFNVICWSCLDMAESVTVEAAQFLERITRRSDTAEENASSPAVDTLTVTGSLGVSSASIAARALHLMTGSQAMRFLQFLAKVAHFNKPMQRRVLEHLASHAEHLELYRLASVVCSIDSFEVVTRLFDGAFSAAIVHGSTRFWVQYGALYGEERAEQARAACAKGVPGMVAHDEPSTTHALDDLIPA